MIIGLRSSKSCVGSVALAFPFQMSLGFSGLEAMVKFSIPMLDSRVSRSEIVCSVTHNAYTNVHNAVLGSQDL